MSAAVEFFLDEEDEDLFSQFQATQKVPDSSFERESSKPVLPRAPSSEWGRLIIQANETTTKLGLKQVYELNGKEGFIIGRGRRATLTITDPTISHKHCRVYVDSGKCYLVDLGSSNGTFLNGNPERLEKDKPVALYSGDLISLVYPNKDEVDENLNPAEQKNYFEFMFKSLLPSVGVRATPTCKELDEKYEVYEILGNGSYATVRRAVHRRTRKEYAIKIVQKKQFAYNNPSRWEDQINEAKMLQKLHHENIVCLEEMILTHEALYMVLEYVRGGELFDRLSEGGPYKENRARLLIYNILKPVAYLHQLGIVHRDLKPENILMVAKEDDINIKLADFGVAKEERGGRGTFCGSMSYIAPEVLKRRDTVLGKGRYGKSADMWSLGVIAYIVLTTTPPFQEGKSTLKQQVEWVTRFVEPEWKKVSMYCKDFIAGLLTIDERKRLTAEKAMQHPWFRGLGKTIAPGNPEASASLRANAIDPAISPNQQLDESTVSGMSELNLTGMAKRKYSVDSAIPSKQLKVITNTNNCLRQDKRPKKL